VVKPILEIPKFEVYEIGSSREVSNIQAAVKVAIYCFLLFGGKKYT
jgi:hypothetical protein